MFPTPEQELESKIREECFKEQIKLLNEISKDINKRVKNLFYSLIQEGVSIRALKKVILNDEKISNEDAKIVELVEKLTKGFFKENKEEKYSPPKIKKEDICD